MAPTDPPTSYVPARAIRRRLLERVADADSSPRTIGADEGDWQPFLNGVSNQPLRERNGVMSCLLRLTLEATLPAHPHPMDPECVVLA